jgi:hypothetical protein
VLSAGGVASFAQKYDFKGVWHAAGKSLSERFVRACESETKKRFSTIMGMLCRLASSGKACPKDRLEKNSRKITSPNYYIQSGIFVNLARTDSLFTSAT